MRHSRLVHGNPFYKPAFSFSQRLQIISENFRLDVPNLRNGKHTDASL